MKVIIDQPFGIGDILFLSPLVQHLDIEEGIWPVADHYFWVKDYLKLDKVTFIPQSQFHKQQYQDYTIVPFQHAHGIVGSRAADCMQAKYMLLDADPELWKTLSFQRNSVQEHSLLDRLGLGDDSKFILVNNHFASRELNYKLDIRLNSELEVVYLEYLDGFTLLDWCGVAERAFEIHTVSTALFFVLESIKPKASLHLYPRKPLDQDLSPIKTLIDSKWICYE